MRKFLTIAALLCAGVPLASQAQGSFPFAMNGKVVYVDDGDTLVLLDQQNQQHRIRLTDLDAPESPKPNHGNKPGQPFSKASGRNLAALAKGKAAKALCYEYDMHNRLVCRVSVDNVDVSLEQIRAGMAWAAPARYVRDTRAFALETEAKRAGRGLWADKSPIPPWIWRRACWQQYQCAGAGE